MNEKPTIKRSVADRRKGQTDWRQVDALSEEEIEEAARSDPDAQPTEAEFWKNATLRMTEPKQLITRHFMPYLEFDVDIAHTDYKCKL
jgi:hypothetical protein